MRHFQISPCTLTILTIQFHPRIAIYFCVTEKKHHLSSAPFDIGTYNMAAMHSKPCWDGNKTVDKVIDETWLVFSDRGKLSWNVHWWLINTKSSMMNSGKWYIQSHMARKTSGRDCVLYSILAQVCLAFNFRLGAILVQLHLREGRSHSIPFINYLLKGVTQLKHIRMTIQALSNLNYKNQTYSQYVMPKLLPNNSTFIIKRWSWRHSIGFGTPNSLAKINAHTEELWWHKLPGWC